MGQISLLGCGWLGLPLAKSLVSKGFKVKGSTTTTSKLDVMAKAGIDPYLVQFTSNSSSDQLTKLLEGDTLIITIPPGRKDPAGFSNYRSMIESVCLGLADSSLSRVILISSTSVYADVNGVVDEYSGSLPDTASGKLMAETESILSQQDINLVILRLAGLIGPGRMPGKFFAGRTSIPNGDAPVNLIYLTDVINIVESLIENKDASGVYNGCAPIHPSRQEFYTRAAELEGLSTPIFTAEKGAWKIVSSARLKQELNYEFKFPSPMEWLVPIRH